MLLLVVRIRGDHYILEVLLNGTLFLCEKLGRAIKRGTETECYFVCCEGLGRAI